VQKGGDYTGSANAISQTRLPGDTVKLWEQLRRQKNAGEGICTDAGVSIRSVVSLAKVQSAQYEQSRGKAIKK